ncbi:pathogenesis-related thaumatin-like protein 3.5 [Mercurialis annua]|uniref:pathogenesis-related thaumatin-like protein 3.5 n=1 Tax=Mercurialis annua TaxID=3986 RepID=UPI00215F2497|nr:pathogenesis-related thaumatin-like protein 3.5 [Mercurialis annua]
MAKWQFLLTLVLISSLGAEAAKFTLQNKCRSTIWPGSLSGGGPLLINGGTRLKPGQSITIDVPHKWSGRFWARTGCHFDRSGKGKCATGDCGGLKHCGGVGGVPPVTLAEFTLDDLNFYDVSLVDGYNVPISIYPYGGTGDCKKVECFANLNPRCPKDLQMRVNGRVVACKSACAAYNTPQYCCTGAYGSPQTCKPTGFSKIFKAACPTYYSYAYDDATSTFTCRWANYTIRFC